MLQISLAILLLIAAYILLVPVDISFSVDSSLSRDMRIKFFPFDIRIDKKKGGKKKKKIDIERLLFDEFKTVNQVVAVFGKFVIALFKSKHHYLNISMQGGFGSPDITGIVLGTIEAVKPAFGNRVTIVYYPDMMAQSVSGNLNAKTVVRVYSVLAEALPLIFRLPMIEIVKILIKIIKGEYNVRTT